MMSDRSAPASLREPGVLFSLLVVCFLCGYLIVTSTINVLPQFEVYDTKRLLEFVLFGILILITLSNTPLRRAFIYQFSRIPKWPGLGIALFFILGVLSSVSNSASLLGLEYSLVEVSLPGLIFVLGLIIAACRSVSGVYFDRVALSLIALLGLAVGVQELTGFVAARSLGLSYSYETALVYFSHPRMFNHLQTWTIPILTALPFVFARNRLAAAICVITLGLNWYVLLETGARGSMVSLAAAFTFVCLVSPVARKTIFKWQSAGMLLGGILFALVLALSGSSGELSYENSQPQSIQHSEGSGSNPDGELAEQRGEEETNEFYNLSLGRPLLHTTGRTWLWREAMNHALEHPSLGIGPMNYACTGPVGRMSSPHNLALQVLSEWGVPAAGLLATLVFILVWKLIKVLSISKENTDPVDPLRVMLITAVFAALVHLMVSSLLTTPASQIAAALTGGWLLGISPGIPTGIKKHAAIAVLCGALLCSLLLQFFGYREIMKMPSYVLQLPAVERARPRLWQLGKVCGDKVQ